MDDTQDAGDSTFEATADLDQKMCDMCGESPATETSYATGMELCEGCNGATEDLMGDGMGGDF